MLSLCTFSSSSINLAFSVAHHTVSASPTALIRLAFSFGESLEESTIFSAWAAWCFDYLLRGDAAEWGVR